ncbi:MAG: YbjN domain-containing protein [Chloroflexales bacterium]|jgi:Putative bacterial sensory transduction regulator
MTENTAHPADELLYPNDVNTESLYALFISAYMNVYRDDVGDVYLKDGYTVWVFPQKAGAQIRLMAQFRAAEGSERLAKLEYANLINDQLKLVRAYVDSDEDVGFDYFIPVEGGITKRNIVLSTRTFIDFIRTALGRDEQNVIA